MYSHNKNEMYTPDSFDSGEKHNAVQSRQKTNEQVGGQRDDVSITISKMKTKPKISRKISPDSFVGSMDSQAQSLARSECGSIRSCHKEIFPGPTHVEASVEGSDLGSDNIFMSRKSDDMDSHRSKDKKKKPEKERKRSKEEKRHDRQHPSHSSSISPPMTPCLTINTDLIDDLPSSMRSRISIDGNKSSKETIELKKTKKKNVQKQSMSDEYAASSAVADENFRNLKPF